MDRETVEFLLAMSTSTLDRILAELRKDYLIANRQEANEIVAYYENVRKIRHYRLYKTQEA